LLGAGDCGAAGVSMAWPRVQVSTPISTMAVEAGRVTNPMHAGRITGNHHFGKERYSTLGIAREDWEARQRAAIANWDCFGAPAALFCYIDRDLGFPQWADPM
jgi:hypothetical protein